MGSVNPFQITQVIIRHFLYSPPRPGFRFIASPERQLPLYRKVMAGDWSDIVLPPGPLNPTQYRLHRPTDLLHQVRWPTNQRTQGVDFDVKDNRQSEENSSN